MPACALSPSPNARPATGVQEEDADKLLPQQIQDLVPESQVYMDLLAFEWELDQTIAHKQIEIQEVIKKPLTQKMKGMDPDPYFQ